MTIVQRILILMSLKCLNFSIEHFSEEEAVWRRIAQMMHSNFGTDSYTFLKDVELFTGAVLERLFEVFQDQVNLLKRR